jgi:hypothetical protein
MNLDLDMEIIKFLIKGKDLKTFKYNIAAIFFILILTSCEPDTITGGSPCYGFSKHRFNYHNYILYRETYACHFIHDPDCECLKNKE